MIEVGCPPIRKRGFHGAFEREGPQKRSQIKKKRGFSIEPFWKELGGNLQGRLKGKGGFLEEKFSWKKNRRAHPSF